MAPPKKKAHRRNVTFPRRNAGSESNRASDTLGDSIFFPFVVEPQSSHSGNTSVVQDFVRLYLSGSSLNPESADQSNRVQQSQNGDTGTAAPASSWYGTSDGYASLTSAQHNLGDVTDYSHNMARLGSLAQEMVHRVRIQQLAYANMPRFLCPDPNLHFRSATHTPVASDLFLTGDHLWPRMPFVNQEPFDVTTVTTRNNRTEANSTEQTEGRGNKAKEGYEETSEAAPTDLTTTQTVMQRSSAGQRGERTELQALKRAFSESNFLTSRKKKKLADRLNLDTTSIINRWFESRRAQNAENKTEEDISASQTKAGCPCSVASSSSESNNTKYSHSATVPENRSTEIARQNYTMTPVYPTELCDNTNSQSPLLNASNAPEYSSSKGKSDNLASTTTVASSPEHNDQLRPTFAITFSLQPEKQDTTLLPPVEPSGNTNSQKLCLGVSNTPESLIRKSYNQVSATTAAPTRQHKRQPSFAITVSLPHAERDTKSRTKSCLPLTEPSDNMKSECLASVPSKNSSLTDNSSAQEISVSEASVSRKHEVKCLPSPAVTVSSQQKGHGNTLGLFPGESSRNTNSQAVSLVSPLPTMHTYLMGNSSIQVPPANKTEVNDNCENQRFPSPALPVPLENAGFCGWKPFPPKNTSCGCNTTASNESSVNHRSSEAFRKDFVHETDESSDSSG